MSMKGFIFAIILFAVTLVQAQPGQIAIDVPTQCMQHVQITMYTLGHYRNGTPKEAMLADLEGAKKNPQIHPGAVEFATQMLEFIYTYPPSSQQEFETLIHGVISYCQASMPSETRVPKKDGFII